MYKDPVSWPSTCPTCEISAMANSARVKQFESQLQQKNATFPVGYSRNHKEFSQNHETWENKFDNKFNQMREETSSVIRETCKEIGRILHKQLQKFAMMLSKRYQVSILVEFFDSPRRDVSDDYLESSNQEMIDLDNQSLGLKDRNRELLKKDLVKEALQPYKFLKMQQSKEKSRLWENDSLLTSKFEQKKYFDLGNIDKKDDCNIRDDIGNKMHSPRGNYNN